MYKKILLAVDGSEGAKKAVSQGVKFAKKIDAKVMAVYVIDTSTFVSLPETFVWESAEGLLKEEGRKVLRNVRETGKRQNIKIETLIREGSPAKEIVESASQEKADLIILGTASRTGLDRFLLGSVSEKVLRTADRPVLVVR